MTPRPALLKAKVKRALRRGRYALRACRNPSPLALRAHLLVVNDPAYANQAELALRSFLWFHPLSSVTIHCDRITFQALRKTRWSAASHKVRLAPDIGVDTAPWQQQKLELLLGLSGTKDIYFDADTRWNGTISELHEPTFLVREFALKDLSPFRQLVAHLGLNFYNDAFMGNTTFFSWAGWPISAEQVSEFRKFHQRFGAVIKSANLGALDHQSLDRLSEQVTMSLLVGKQFQRVGFLKDHDSPFDGGIVESSYFGATGATF